MITILIILLILLVIMAALLYYKCKYYRMMYSLAQKRMEELRQNDEEYARFATQENFPIHKDFKDHPNTKHKLDTEIDSMNK